MSATKIHGYKRKGLSILTEKNPPQTDENLSQTDKQAKKEQKAAAMTAAASG